jgi:fatty-acyl-CoA synthase
MTMYEAFHRVASRRMEQEALVCDQERLTYAQLLEQVDVLARGFYQLGLRQGDRVALPLPPGPAFVYAFFALARLGAVVVPLNPQFRRRTLGAMLGAASPVALVAAEPIDQEALSQAPSLRVGTTSGLILAGGAHEGSLTLEGLMAPAEAGPLPFPEVEPEDLLALLYTSGTTGMPKGAMHTHRSLIAPVVASIALRDLWTKRPTLQTIGKMAKALVRYRERLLRAAGRPQTFLSTGGWHTITGLEVMLQGLLMGDRLVVMPRFNPRQALQWIEQERVTVLVAVPMALHVMLSLQKAEPRDTSSLLICGTGAAPCPPSLAREIQQVFGCAVHIGFGATETAGGIAATSLADSDDRQSETVGRPMPGMEVRIVDEQRREVPPGEVGELACRSDSVMLGYFGAPEATAQVLDEEGWYHTGDLARVDEGGYIHIVGRKKDMIIRGGQNIYPAEIEIYLASHPKVQEVAVVGVPSPLGDESVWAFVLTEEGAEMTSLEVLDYCRQELEPYQIPSHVEFVAELPRSQTGKPQKFKLREAALNRISGDPRT